MEIGRRSPELGSWDPAKAVRPTDNSAYPTWKDHIALPPGQTVEWKCLIRRESDAAQVKPGRQTRKIA
jgi:alpha-amylase